MIRLIYSIFMVFVVVSSVLGAASSSNAQSFKRLYVNGQPGDKTFPLNAADFKKLTYVKTLSGGTGGVQILQSADKHQFTFKCIDNQEQMKVEILADALYKSLGVLVPDFAAYQTDGSAMPANVKCHGIFRLARFIAPARSHAHDHDAQEVSKHFLVDAFLANWDIVVGELKNIVIDQQGQYWRVDNGGSLQYSALGGLKADKGWNPFVVSELETMRNPQINDGAGYYAGLTDGDLKSQLEDILKHKA